MQDVEARCSQHLLSGREGEEAQVRPIHDPPLFVLEATGQQAQTDFEMSDVPHRALYPPASAWAVCVARIHRYSQQRTRHRESRSDRLSAAPADTESLPRA